MNLLNDIREAPVSSLEEMVKLAPSGLYMEFGVYQGYTLNRIASVTDNTVYGFDSFKGLPEDWYMQKKGDFTCLPPTNLKENVELVIGWYDETIPKFMKKYKEPVAFIHIDCDLYSSTKCVFDNIKDRLQNGTIIVFDELYAYEGYEEHEWKAFHEFILTNGLRFECVGKYSNHQAGFKIYV